MEPEFVQILQNMQDKHKAELEKLQKVIRDLKKKNDGECSYRKFILPEYTFLIYFP